MIYCLTLWQAIGLSIGAILCELVFSFIAIGGVELETIFVDPFAKYLEPTLDFIWSKGRRDGLRVLGEGYAIPLVSLMR
jgi:hypothetical protein